ncbi:YchJ family metal-binding protein [Brachybacterium sp. p3-SID1565]|uniref:SEC-C domain-containing protein n=1 Tax=Brachybacterium epidermidis TaxID=2781983 RepID=A0ABR9VXV9_9MICO|nr:MULTISPECIES: YchJ family metal-binding protein [Brachybacterium]MBE9403019.1 SEC-C domain-containing protein [Brachybacterium epidermidis]MCT1385112.1 YchJ family metal-binding protein [Brachybacterium sp. p3-SID1565]
MSSSTRHPANDERCPCGSGDTFGSCCGPVLTGKRRAATAEALMRSRYTAFTTQDLEHALASWHPDTRPDRADLARSLADTRWLRLDVRGTTGGGPFDDEGTVEFVAIARTEQGRRELHEISHFTRVDGSWLYVRGDLAATRH